MGGGVAAVWRSKNGSLDSRSLATDDDKDDEDEFDNSLGGNLKFDIIF